MEKKISEAYHSGYGHTGNQANGIVIDQNGESTEPDWQALDASDASTDEAPTAGDIETAKAFGARVATVVRDLVR